MAEPLAAPGDTRLRHDLQLLNDSGAINIPLTAWPVALGDVHNALNSVNVAAQWCGDGSPCDGSVFLDLVAGKDNRGVNVAPEDEPGNQLGGIDIRWSLPGNIPVATYMQWIGEDGRGGGGAIGSWMRQLGLE